MLDFTSCIAHEQIQRNNVYLHNLGESLAQIAWILYNELACFKMEVKQNRWTC